MTPPVLDRDAVTGVAADAPAVSSAGPVPAPGRLSRLVHGPTGDPSWARPALLVLLLTTGLLYGWKLGASGDSNSFYAAAVQAGTKSWKAMFFGSSDAGNAITVDKPALFLWPMEISGRLFGYSTWSMLVPQVLEGVAAVGLLAATVRRTSGHLAGLVAGAVLALTPVAAMMFVFNNPDAMLTLLLVAAGYCLVRALQPHGTRWVTLAGTLVGLAFVAKMGQALLVVPALGLTYLVAAPSPLRRRITDLLGAGGAMVAAAGWWVAAVELWPAASRPYIGGSTDNSVLGLAFGYNGLGRLFGNTAGNGGARAGALGGGGLAGGPGGGGTLFGGPTGLDRMFTGDWATEVSWLLPTALLALVVGLWLTRRAPRTDLSRAVLVLFGGWLLVTGLVFSSMQGTAHPYYAVALAPAIAGLVAVTGQLLWQARATWTSRVASAVLLEVSAVWSAHLLATTPTFLPALRYAIVAVATVGVVWLLAGPSLRKGVAVVAAASVLTGVAGTAAFAVDTASQSHSGSIPSAGPAGSRTGGGFGRAFGGAPPAGASGPGAAGPGAAGPGSAGGQSANVAVVALLKAATTRWAAATTGSMASAPLQLASGRPVMGIGGFTGSDPAPTLAQFQGYVAAGEIHFYVAGGGFAGGRGFGGASGTGSQITTWVSAHYTSSTVGGTTVYDLTQPAH